MDIRSTVQGKLIAMRKTIISLVIAAIMTMSLCSVPHATAIPSDWSAYEVELAHQWGLVDPDLLYYVSSLDTLTKDMLCSMVVLLCEKLTATVIESDRSVVFEDDDWYIPEHFYKAYAAGIVSGKGLTSDGKVILGKADEMGREEVFTMLYNAIVYCYPDQEVTSGDIDGILSVFSDSADISQWARKSAAYMSLQGIIRGADGRYMPKERCTVEQGIVTVKRIYETFSTDDDRSVSPLITYNLEAPVFTSPANGSSHDIQNGVILRWEPVEGAVSYRLRLMTDQGMLDHFVSQPSASLDGWMLTTGTNVFSLTSVDGNRQVISRPARLTLQITGVRTEFVRVSTRNEEDYVFDFSTREEAMQYMTTVTVPVWRLRNGEKVAANMTLTVHRYVAGDVITIFNEIFNGPEKFPIHSVGGFDWRNGRGEHPMGTAIDINPTQNYQIFADGRIGAGSYWKPGEDPLSIPQGGDVERAFRRLGWGWGGADWSSNKDYMHFSFFGT